MNFETLYEKFKDQTQTGFVCPLFFLQTEDSSQIGEYPDLKKLADFAKRCGFHIIQLLPIFDTGPESSPYSSRSCFALNPVYISLRALNFFKETDPIYASLYQNKDALHFDYQDVYTKKLKLLEDYIRENELFFKSDPAFQAFCFKNPWLIDYAAFCAYRKNNPNLPETWDIEITDIEQKMPFEVFLHKVMQFICHNQLIDAKNYSDSLGLHIMGDIPILLSPDSCEMWTHRNLFDFSLTVGAAPDQFSKEGQSWGFPMIRFMAKPQACASFWKMRINHLSQYFSLYRIDHAVGFFRLWVIPKGKKAKEGFFFPADDATALLNARSLFDQLFKNSPMVPIAEDLGVIPDFVKKFFKETHLCGTKVVRWERDWLHGGQLTPFNTYPFYSLCTLSTHDTTFMFQEWQQDPSLAEHFSRLLNLINPKECSPKIQEEILRHIHQSSSLFIINMIQEYLYLHPVFKNKLLRINVPGPTSPQNWSTKMCIPIERLSEDKEFCEKLKAIILNT